MITYFYQNKGNFRICEDSLTSTVFDLLKYLPTEVFWNILCKSLYHNKLPKFPGEILEFTYWTKWNAQETTNSIYVEPDLFIRFSEFDLIIEAKRYNKNQQSEAQITKQITSYNNEFFEDNKKLYILQLGGLWNIDEIDYKFEGEKKTIFCKTDWTKILDQIVVEKTKLNNVEYSQTNSFNRIFADLIKGFELHGFYKKIWLNSMKSINISNQNPQTLFSYAIKH